MRNSRVNFLIKIQILAAGDYFYLPHPVHSSSEQINTMTDYERCSLFELIKLLRIRNAKITPLNLNTETQIIEVNVTDNNVRHRLHVCFVLFLISTKFVYEKDPL